MHPDGDVGLHVSRSSGCRRWSPSPRRGAHAPLLVRVRANRGARNRWQPQVSAGCEGPRQGEPDQMTPSLTKAQLGELLRAPSDRESPSTARLGACREGCAILSDLPGRPVAHQARPSGRGWPRSPMASRRSAARPNETFPGGVPHLRGAAARAGRRSVPWGGHAPPGSPTATDVLSSRRWPRPVRRPLVLATDRSQSLKISKQPAPGGPGAQIEAIDIRSTLPRRVTLKEVEMNMYINSSCRRGRRRRSSQARACDFAAPSSRPDRGLPPRARVAALRDPAVHVLGRPTEAAWAPGEGLEADYSRRERPEPRDTMPTSRSLNVE